MIKYLIFAAALALTGCQSTRLVIERVEAVNDGILETSIKALCGTPYSAIIRNTARFPTLPAGLKTLCGKI